MRSRIKVIAIALLIISALLGTAAYNAIPRVKPDLFIDKAEFRPGEAISVRFQAPWGYDRTAWIGIIPSSVPHGSERVNDENDLTYAYLDNRREGSILLSAPEKTGSYDLRMHDTDSNGREVAHISFTVIDVQQSVIMELDRSKARPGDKVTLYYDGIPNPRVEDWIGIFTAGVQNEHVPEVHYLGGQSKGSVRFSAPNKPGKYDFRIHLAMTSGQSYIVVSKETLLVEPAPGQGSPPDQPPALSLKKDVLEPYEQFYVSFTAPNNFSSNAWVGIIPSEVEHGFEEINDRHDISYRYLHNLRQGELLFSAPADPGKYDLRMHDTDSSGREAAYVSFTVRSPHHTPPDPARRAVLKVEPLEVYVGQSITIYFSNIPSPVKTDWISIYPVQYSNQQYGQWSYLDGKGSGQLTFTAPSTPGQYECRLFLNWPSGGYYDVARSARIWVISNQ